MSLEITAELSNGDLTVKGTGFPASSTAVVQITREGTLLSARPEVTTDDSGAFSTTISPFCGDPNVGPGTYEIAATNGEPQPGAEYNTEWSNIVSVTCGGSENQPTGTPPPDGTPTPTPSA